MWSGGLRSCRCSRRPHVYGACVFWAMIELGAPIARRVFMGVTEWKLVWGSAPVAVIVVFQVLFVSVTCYDFVNAVCVLFGDDHAGCTNSL